MDEITEKNKEIQKLRKANSGILSNKDKMNQLSKLWEKMKDKKLEMCEMSLKV